MRGFLVSTLTALAVSLPMMPAVAITPSVTAQQSTSVTAVVSRALPSCGDGYTVPFMPIRLKGDNRDRPIIKAQLRQKPFTKRLCVRVWRVNDRFRVNPPSVTWYDTRTGPARLIDYGWVSKYRTDDRSITWSVGVEYKRRGTDNWRSGTTGRQTYTINY